MKYRISRNGQVFGPYTTAEVHQYLASGNILLSDLAQLEGTETWTPVEQLFPAATVPPTAAYAAGAQAMPAAAAGGRLYPDPPDFPWWAALILGLVTGGLFFVLWDVWEAYWLYRIEPATRALWLYVACAVFYLLRFPATYHTVTYNIFGGEIYHAHHAGGLGLISFVLAIAARFVFRSELERHFNILEPIGLRLGPIMTFFFGGLYFQYHFNRINEWKRAMHVSVKN